MRCIGFALILSLGGAIVGCGNSEAQPPASPPLPPRVEYFQRNQAQTMTPHGRVLAETATGTPDGGIQYRTEDGANWKVSATPNGDGGYTYGTPIPSK